MAYPQTNVSNLADGSAIVGAQAQVIHGDVYNYVVRQGASPKEKYEVGIRYLTIGVRPIALQWIGQAIAERHDTSEVWFHWLLALLSDRTSRQLSPEDISQLEALEKDPVVYQHDPWSDGIRAVLQLLNVIRSPSKDPGPFIDALDQLHPDQKNPVFRHLSVFLQGPKGDRIWQDAVEAAKAGRCAKGRDKRAKYFFYLRPAAPHRRQVPQAAVSSHDRLMVVIASVTFVLALLGIAWVLATHVSIAGLAGILIGCGGLCLAAANWTEFRWQARRRAEYHQLVAPDRSTVPPQQLSRLATRIDERFDWYLRKYPPKKADVTSWLSATRGIRNQLRDEIAEIYRDKRVKVEQLNWLITHEVWLLAKRWDGGTFYDPPQHESRLNPMALWGGITATVIGGLLAAGSLLSAEPVGGFIALAIIVVSGYRGVRRWTSISLAQRQAAADEAESKRKYAERQADYDAYLAKFDALQPRDQMMAEWLEHDKKVILEYALKYFSLKRSDVVSYAILENPSSPYKRASVRNGPWRYTRYKITVFLLTANGIRQVSYELRTNDGDIQQLNDDLCYPYDAITLVAGGRREDGNRQEFHLHLESGKILTFRVATALTALATEDYETEDVFSETDIKVLSTATGNSTGIENTFRILRGVAADGKEWIARESQ